MDAGSPPPLQISPGFRVALAAKALLLLGLAALLIWPGFRIATGDGWRAARVGAGLVFGMLGVFLAWAASLGVLDALLGRSERSAGAVALQSRRNGNSLQLPDGRFVEFILWNPWQPLVPGRRYTVTFGRHSMVLVRAPEPEVTDSA